MNIEDWAQRHGISEAALAELRGHLGAAVSDPAPGGKSEAAAQIEVRLEASRKGLRLWRNNVGAMYDEGGRFVRFGLANESAGMNKVIKSGDLIGIRPLLITPAHVGRTIGQFVSREIKAPGWRYTGTEREVGQLAWATLVTALGGDATFATGAGTL